MLDWLDDDIPDLPGETPAPVPVAKDQIPLFGEELRSRYQHWDGMPEYVQEDIRPWAELVVKFATLEDRQRFAEVIGQPIRSEQYSIWYPQIRIGSYWDKRFRDVNAPPLCIAHGAGHHATQDEADLCDGPRTAK